MLRADSTLRFVKTELLDSAVRTIDKDTLWHCVPSQLQKCLDTTFADGQYSDEAA